MKTLSTSQKTKKWEVVYTADQLVRIGNSLRHGEAVRIAERAATNYTNVKIVLSGNRNQGITNKAKTALRIVEEALAIIESYEKDLSNQIFRLDEQRKIYYHLRTGLHISEAPAILY